MLSLLIALLPTLHAIDLGLVASSGCYSHDKTLRSLVTDATWNVSWIQVKIFDFGKKVDLPDTWKQHIFERNKHSMDNYVKSVQNTTSHDDIVHSDNQSLHSFGGPLLWYGNVPFEPERIIDFRGLKLFYNIVMSHRRHCLNFMKSKEFIRLKEYEFSVVVLDHFVQECLTVLSSKMAPSIIQYSNWPVSDGYLTSMNVPSYPSYVPTTGTTFSDKKLVYTERILNTVAFIFIKMVRLFQSIIIRIDFINSEYQSNLFEHEASHLLYTVRSEFLLESVRPRNNRIKHFGCSSCGGSISPTKPILYPENIFSSKFLLVTLGSLSNVEYLPKRLLKKILKAFSQSRFNVIWQFNGKLNTRSINIPRNVYFVDWIQLEQVFSHPNIQYVIIHGGINTLNEAVHSGLPSIGIPLQGDQNSNLKSLEVLGTTKILRMVNVWDNMLGTTIQKFEINLLSYKERAEKVAKMVKEYRSNIGDNSEYWINWADRHGKVLKTRKCYIGNEYISFSHYFGLFDFTFYAVAILSLLLFFTK